MSTYSSLGVGAGLDLQTLLSKLMDAERVPAKLLGQRSQQPTPRSRLMARYVHGWMRSNLRRTPCVSSPAWSPKLSVPPTLL